MKFTKGTFTKGTDEVYRCDAFVELGCVDHGFGTRHAAFAPGSLTTLRQVHSALVMDAAGLTDRACEGDALISKEPGKKIAVRTADCVPVLLFDTRLKAVAAIHAGWRGTAVAIAAKAVELLGSSWGTDPTDVQAAIGPAIRRCCYEVGDEVAARFPERVVSRREGRTRVDLIAANAEILVNAGVPRGQIYDSGLCTFCNAAEFFSYRREPGDPGRLLSYIQVECQP